MKRIDITDYMADMRNEHGVAKFVEKQCKCGQDLTIASPVNPKVQNPDNASGECPRCGQEHHLVIPEFISIPYHVKDSLVELLMARDNQLTGREILERDVTARKILACTDGYVLLEDDEWNKLNMATNTVRGLGRSDVELIRRIVDAEKVEVEVKQ